VKVATTIVKDSTSPVQGGTILTGTRALFRLWRGR
jgi:hypothetical protein